MLAVTALKHSLYMIGKLQKSTIENFIQTRSKSAFYNFESVLEMTIKDLVTV